MGWPEQLYVREALRLVGDRVLVQNGMNLIQIYIVYLKFT